LLRSALSEEPDLSFVAAAHAATAGNPFLLSELITTLVARDMFPTAGEAGHVSAIGPQGVRSAILRRLGRLGEGATALARAAAVLGSGAELRHAAALAELSDETAAGAGARPHCAGQRLSGAAARSYATPLRLPSSATKRPPGS